MTRPKPPADTLAASPLDRRLLKLIVYFESDTIALHRQSQCGIPGKDMTSILAENRRKLLSALRAAFDEEVHDV